MAHIIHVKSEKYAKQEKHYKEKHRKEARRRKERRSEAEATKILADALSKLRGED